MEPVHEVVIAARSGGVITRGDRWAPPASGGATRGSDSVTLSSSGVRRELVDRVRSQIESGHYENEQRLSAAAGTLLHALGSR